ncbi:tartrate dehydrogenase [Kineococcus sp. SYSU DK003]|uniref:tartrate dehydrogenase n=1 Tax=Kineococcus sp. SYSU DK003 TaxID=3383124 RepID=UPI003D7EC3D4
MSSFPVHRIAVLPGDGIGTEVIPAGQRVLDAAAQRHEFSLTWQEHSWGSAHYRRYGRMMPTDALDTLRDSDAIYLGAVGSPDIDDVQTLWGMLIPIRREFDQYVNLRPIRSLPGVEAPLRRSEGIDVVVVRENTEGEYSDVGGRSYRGTEHEAAYQQAVFTRRGVRRVAQYAADLAVRRAGRLVSATKSNGIIHTMPFWDEVVRETVAQTPGLALESVLIDALAARLVMRPQSLDVVVASNLFGDILSDLAAATVGSIGIAPSANLNPEHRFPSLFEPVHGSAPDIAGTGLANPVGAIWAGAMMLDHLGHAAAADTVINAFTAVLGTGMATPDLGGNCSTTQFADAVIAEISR